jgi:hypothetical protein
MENNEKKTKKKTKTVSKNDDYITVADGVYLNKQTGETVDEECDIIDDTQIFLNIKNIAIT